MDLRAETATIIPIGFSPEPEWAKLRDDMPMTLAADRSVAALRSMHDRLDLTEVEEIYLPLSRLLSIYVASMQGCLSPSDGFSASMIVRCRISSA